MNIALTCTLLLSAALLAACDDGPSGPTPPNGTIPILGHGVVTERFTAEVAALGQHAYTSTWGNRMGMAGNAVKVWNTAGAPVLVDSLIVPQADVIGDVQISDDGALLVIATEYVGGSILIYGLANPARPAFMSRHMSDNTRFSGVHTVKLGRVGGRHYAFLSVNPAGTQHPAQLVIVDITDPASPQEVLVKPMGMPFIHDVFVRDGLLFTALWNDGMTIWDIGGGGRGGSPASPVQISNIVTVGAHDPQAARVHNIWWFHDAQGQERYAFVGEEGPGSIGASSSGDIHVVDISDIEQPREVAFYSVPGAGAHNFVMDEEAGILYAAYYNGGVRAIDVTGDLGTCTGAQRAPDGRCDLGRMGRELATGLTERGQISIWGVARVGNVLHASDMLSGIFKLDISGVGR